MLHTVANNIFYTGAQNRAIRKINQIDGAHNGSRLHCHDTAQRMSDPIKLLTIGKRRQKGIVGA